MAQWGFSQSITPKFEHKLRRHEQRFEKLPPRLYQMKMKICYDQGCNEIVADIDRFHSRDQYLDYRCYAAILVYLNGKQTGSVLRVEHGFVHDRWLWQQKWTR